MAFANLSLKLPLIFLALFLQTSAGRFLDSFTSAISFGDSLADTGNLLYCLPTVYAGYFPYGETFFNRPTGRFSDGRLVIDFIAQDIGIPYLPPYLQIAQNTSFSRGVNFAVGGATALDAKFFAARGLALPTNDSLGVQLGWFEKVLPSICSSGSDCKNVLRSTLFVLGEIGGNDFNYPFFRGWSIQKVESLIPSVVAAIESAIKTLIKHGATTLIVPGNLPLGCNAIYLTAFQSTNVGDYDQSNCLIKYNNFSKLQNRQLIKMLYNVQLCHPEATIIYADFYTAAMRIYSFRQQLGFGRGGLRACCGSGGPYNYNPLVMCGTQGATACDDPSSYISWDGIHLTEAAYRAIYEGLKLNGSFLHHFPLPTK